MLDVNMNSNNFNPNFIGTRDEVYVRDDIDNLFIGDCNSFVVFFNR